jgi:hypothetical protein
MMLRMKRRVMRRLQNICSTNRPKGFCQPTRPLDANLWDVAVDKPSRRFLSGDKVLQSNPSGRYTRTTNVPKGLSWRLDLSKRAFGTRVKPSGWFRC